MPATFGKKSTVEQGEMGRLLNPEFSDQEKSVSSRHGPTKRQRIYHKADTMPRKANNKGHDTMLDRFLNDPLYRESQTNIGWDENT